MVIIDDILDFSKIEAGKIELETTTYNLLDLLHEVGRLHTVKAQQKVFNWFVISTLSYL